RFSIGGNNRPAVFEMFDVFGAEVDHRLDCHDHSLDKQFTAAAFATIRHFGFFVHFLAEPVPDEFTHNAIAKTFGILLDRIGNITHAIARPEFANPDV